jgi:hypothetical protein
MIRRACIRFPSLLLRPTTDLRIPVAAYAAVAEWIDPAVRVSELNRARKSTRQELSIYRSPCHRFFNKKRPHANSSRRLTWWPSSLVPMERDERVVDITLGH